MRNDGDPAVPITRAGRAAMDALNAAMWSSTSADRLFAIVRPADFLPGDDTIAAAILDLRRQHVSWTDPTPVIENLRYYQDLWKQRVDSGRFGMPPVPTPAEDHLDPDRTPLRFAGRALQTFHAYDVMRHLPQVDVDTAARQVAASRRHEVAEATMQTVHRILTEPPPGSTRRERQEAVGHIVREYRQIMTAQHLYPPRTKPRRRDQSGMTR